MSSLSQRRRILMISGADFSGALVSRFAQEIKAGGNYEVFALGVQNSTGRAINAPLSTVFAGVSPFPAPGPPSRDFRAALQCCIDLLSARNVPALGQNGTLKKWLARRIAWGCYKRELPPLIGGYDLYHWHCFLPDLLPILRWFPKDAKLIISLWGSDLYRTAGIEEYALQLEACGRATLIAVGSLEMRETFCAKFGRQWQDRVRVLTYGADNLDLVDRAREQRDAFARGIGASPDKVIICIGNNASRMNQHIDALNSIAAALSVEQLKTVVFVLPMTYGQEPSYMETVKKAARQYPAPVRVLENYLSDLEVAQLRSSCDITIHIPVSDQFSASMCEALYAGSVVITGAWLPYSRLRLNGVPYHEIGGPSDVGEKVRSILPVLEAEKQRAMNAAPIIWHLMSWEEVRKTWKDVYNELLQ